MNQKIMNQLSNNNQRKRIMTEINLGDFRLRFDPKEVRINIDGEMIDVGAKRESHCEDPRYMTNADFEREIKIRKGIRDQQSSQKLLE